MDAIRRDFLLKNGNFHLPLLICSLFFGTKKWSESLYLTTGKWLFFSLKIPTNFHKEIIIPILIFLFCHYRFCPIYSFFPLHLCLYIWPFKYLNSFFLMIIFPPKFFINMILILISYEANKIKDFHVSLRLVKILHAY